MRLPLSAYSAHSVQETGIILGYSPRARSIRLVLRVCPAGGFRARTGVQRAEPPSPRGQAGGVARLRFPARYYATGVGRAWRAGETRDRGNIYNNPVARGPTPPLACAASPHRGP